jgi:low temperature requirement protein LtrA
VTDKVNNEVTHEASHEVSHEATHEVTGKRVSWVELYFDLIFVFAVAQVAHAIAEDPHRGRVFAALGLFVTLWWTWIGFAVLYNRRGEDRPMDRLFVLIGTVPCAVAATQAHHVFEAHPAGFALALAGVRLLLFVANVAGDPHRSVARGYLISTVLFALSAVIPPPWGYPLWAVAVLQESAFLLLGERRRQIRDRRARNGPGGIRQNRAELLRAQLAPPTDGSRALDAGHLAERFGLFMIILLGELVLTVGAAALDHPTRDLGYWLSLIGGLVLAGALWWVYFDSAADINEQLLRASGGNPALAHSLYAAGHLIPAFALLVVAAGVNLSLHEHPPAAASWLTTIGLAAYLAGTRAFTASSNRRWYAVALRFVAMAATVCLALLDRVLVAPAVVAVAAGWAVGAAAIVTAFRGRLAQRLRDLVA